MSKTVLITGCSEGGIGSALAKTFASQGYIVFATVRATSKAGSLSQVPNIKILELELASKESISRCAETVKDQTGGTLDVLVNNAGADFVMPLLDADIDEAKQLFDVNVWGVLAMTQAFAPSLVRAKGVVCNMSSVAPLMPLAFAGIYSGSKAAMAQMSETLRCELDPLGVRVITVLVGAVHTPTHEKAGELKLPANSYYQSIREIINDQRKGAMKPPSQDPGVTAANIVKDIIGGSNGLVYRGNLASVCRYLSWLLPTSLAEYLANGNKGLSKVKHGDK